MAARELLLHLESHNDSVLLNREQRQEILRRLERLEELEEENRRPREELHGFRTLASTPASSDRTVEAGGGPSSRIFYRRPVPEAERHPSGGQPGHPGHGRPRSVPNAPPVRIALKCCPSCSTKLGTPCGFFRRTSADLPLPALPVFELEVLRYWCRRCSRRVHTEPPLPPKQQFGPVLAAWIAHQRILGLSVEKARTSLAESFDVALGEASILALQRWVAERLAPEYAKLRARVKEAPVVGADETSFRINGQNGWLSVYEHLAATVYQIAPTRGRAALPEVLEGYEGTLGLEAWDPHDAITTADHALDPVHVNWRLERAEV